MLMALICLTYLQPGRALACQPHVFDPPHKVNRKYWKDLAHYDLKRDEANEPQTL
jgi:hypothetical protein